MFKRAVCSFVGASSTQTPLVPRTQPYKGALKSPWGWSEGVVSIRSWNRGRERSKGLEPAGGGLFAHDEGRGDGDREGMFRR